MGSIEITRTWTATIEVQDRRTGRVTVLDASRSEWDLLRDQIAVGVREAWLLGVVNSRDEFVRVVLWKTTKARGTERDRSFVPFLDRRGVLRYDGPYAG